MVKVFEDAWFEDGRLYVQETHDYTPELEQIQRERSAGLVGTKDMWRVGAMPEHMFWWLAAKHGVKHGDFDAAREVIVKMLNDSDYKALRLKEGRI